MNFIKHFMASKKSTKKTVKKVVAKTVESTPTEKAPRNSYKVRLGMNNPRI